MTLDQLRTLQCIHDDLNRTINEVRMDALQNEDGHNYKDSQDVVSLVDARKAIQLVLAHLDLSGMAIA